MLINKRTSFLAIAMVLMILFVVSGCSNSTVNSGNAAKTVQTQNDSNLKTFTLEELKKFDGQYGNPAYIAVDGKVYDVTNIKPWKGGQHQGYKAGVDLSEAIKNAPHGKKVLDNVPVVGKLVN